MNRTVILSIAICLMAFSNGMAQVDPHTIGLRFGGGDGFNAEVTYQRGLSERNRLELDLGYSVGDNHSSFLLNGIYHWVFDIDQGFAWYVGPGASAGFYSNDVSESDDFILNAVGQVGLQYRFDFPLQLSLDFRPAVEVLPDFGDLHGSIGFSIRYAFGSN